jgi:hypothetical protein
MTGTNCTLDAARNGPKKQRQLLGKERLADGNPFSLLTAHANGRPFPFLADFTGQTPASVAAKTKAKCIVFMMTPFLWLQHR